MVLRGGHAGFSPPFDASLYGDSFSIDTPASEYQIEYQNCTSIVALFRTTSDVVDLLPEDVEPTTDPPTAGVILAHYPFSTVGAYHEYIGLVEVEDLEGERAYYIPYIYVTNDAAMAAGREMAGAPKKLASMDLDESGTIVHGTLERPTGTELLSLSIKPEQRAGTGLLGGNTPLLSVRHLPPIEGGDGCTQLVKWYAKMDYHLDAAGSPRQWTGPTTIEYPDRSSHDPIANLAVDQLVMGLYGHFDMVLGATEVQREWEL